MFTINNYSVLAKTAVVFAGFMGWKHGNAAQVEVATEWDHHQLRIAKKWKQYEAAHAPGSKAAGSDAPLEFAPGVPVPAEIAEIVKAL